MLLVISCSVVFFHCPHIAVDGEDHIFKPRVQRGDLSNALNSALSAGILLQILFCCLCYKVLEEDVLYVGLFLFSFHFALHHWHRGLCLFRFFCFSLHTHTHTRFFFNLL